NATDFLCSVTVKDNLGVTSPAVPVRILVPMVITTATLPNTEQTLPSYAATLQAMGGSGVYSWAALGALPSGLSLDSSSGVISGAVGATAATQKFTIQVAGSANDTAVTQDFTIAVTPRLAIAIPSGLTFAIGGTNESLPLLTIAG